MVASTASCSNVMPPSITRGVGRCCVVEQSPVPLDEEAVVVGLRLGGIPRAQVDHLPVDTERFELSTSWSQRTCAAG
jgi:hypothetical protein